jgi:small subunit ribosomal protein S6
MLRYEVLFLVVPQVTADETVMLETQFQKMIKEAKGTLISYERWGKYRLAYQILNYEYGVYFLARFEVEKESLNNLLSAIRVFFTVKHNELVMRHVVTRLDNKASLDYERPESLEDASSRDDFYKNNRGPSMTSSAPSYEDVLEENIDVHTSVE